MKVLFLVFALSLPGLTGCRTPVPLPRVDLAEPGWRVQESQVVWIPQRRAPSLVGELLLATHSDGRTFSQFSKQGLPVVSTRTALGAWRFEAPMFHHVHQGLGDPPRRVPWFQIRSIPPDASVQEPWRLEVQPLNRTWKLYQPGTGESVEGVWP